MDRLVGDLFRKEAGKMTAVLTRLLGVQSLTAAEDIVQETLLRALSAWKIKGVPDNPTGWLYTVARRMALDHLRKIAITNRHTPELKWHTSEWALATETQTSFLDHEIMDSQLRLMFACCHPELSSESQAALILKTLCGLSTREIAASFLTHEDTMQKRLVRAHQRLRDLNPSLDTPAPVHVQARIDTVLLVLYLLFNEGYHAHDSDTAIREDLCAEAMRLCALLLDAADTDLPSARALLALMHFQVARFPARVGSDNSPVLLKDQDRSKWNHELIIRGERLLNEAAAGDHLTAYHLEAAIAGLHCKAQRFESTDWTTICRLYDQLVRLTPSAPVRLNRAIAVGYSTTPEKGIEALNELNEECRESAYYYSALGDFQKATDDLQKARTSYERALALAGTKHERRVMMDKINALESGNGESAIATHA